MALTILLTSVGSRVELVQAFRNAAKDLQIPLTIIGADVSELAPALYFCTQAEIVPPIASEDYIPALLRICRARGVNALIPTIDTDLPLLADNRQRFEALGTQVCIMDPDKIAICRDKRQTAAYFRSLGLTTPETVDHFEHYTAGFPAFIKPFNGSASIGANRAEDQAELAFYAAKLPDGYIVQPFIHGTEYTVDVFCDFQGDPVYITPRVRIALRAGEVLKTRVHHRPDITRQILLLLRQLRPRGPVTVQLIRDAAGTNHFLEINPRFGGGAPLSMMAGANSARALLRILMGEKVEYVPEAADEGATFSRFDQSVRLDGCKDP